ncbi:hypothetical protein HWV62_44896 [Athelia sp. TMB]|nr:hypothetical protein HWV62_44896 [Athelia sp. TMB]
MAGTQWNFPDLRDTQPKGQHQEQMAGNNHQSQPFHPEQVRALPSLYSPQHGTQERSRPPFTPLPYNNPLNHTFPMPPDTPTNYYTVHRDALYAQMMFGDAMARDQHMNDKDEHAARAELSERVRNSHGGHEYDHAHAERDENTSKHAHVEPAAQRHANRSSRVDDLAGDAAPQPKPTGRKKPAAGKDLAKTKKLGTGARSGMLNHHTAGGLDAEIKELDAKEVEGSAVTPHSTVWTDAEKLQVVNYVTLEKVWKHWKVNKAKELLNISQKLFASKHDGKAIDNLWSRFWAMFKIVRWRQEHTGGGDGDEDDGTDLEGDGGGKGESVKKRKVSKRICFLKSVLDMFEKSVYFRALDKVYVISFDASEAQHIYSIVSSAHSHVEIVRSRAFNSSLEISDGKDAKPVRGRKKAKLNSDDEDESGGALKSLMETLRGRNTTRDRVDAERLQNDRDTLALAQKKEGREARLADAHWAAGKEAKDWEEERKADAAKCENWDRAMKWMESPNAMMQAVGEKLAKKLAEEEGIPVE